MFLRYSPIAALLVCLLAGTALPISAAFNNTGQMIGYADFGSYGLTLGTRCIAFAGTKFINVTRWRFDVRALERQG